jgi:tetratricopeptide (TPR) repeat protein
LRQHSILRQFANADKKFFSIHRLMQSHTRSRLVGQETKEAFTYAILLLHHSYPKYSPAGLPTTTIERECSLYTKHVLAVSAHFEAEMPTITAIDLEKYAVLLHVTSQYLWEHGSWDKAWQLLRMAEQTCQLAQSSNLVLRGHVACGLGVFCLEDSLVDEAVKYNKTYVELRKQYNASLGPRVGPDEILMLSNAYNNLGNAYCAQGDYQKALGTHEQSLRLRSAQNHSLYIALSQSNISRVLQLMGHLDQSKERAQIALDLQAVETGIDDIRYSLYLHNMGSILGDMKDWSKAADYHSRALAIREGHLGRTNDTAVTQHMLACCLVELGDYDRAW